MLTEGTEALSATESFLIFSITFLAELRSTAVERVVWFILALAFGVFIWTGAVCAR